MAFECGDLRDADTLRDWLEALVVHGSLRNDLILFACTARAIEAGDDAALAEIAELALALANSAERRLETVTQGNAFIAALRAAWPCDAIERLKRVWPGDVAYPVAVAAASAGHALPLAASLEAYGLAFVANLVSASVRLGIVGQTDGQKLTAGLVPAVQAAARRPRLRRRRISAAAPSAPTSPRCATRRSIRGCSARERGPRLATLVIHAPGRTGPPHRLIVQGTSQMSRSPHGPSASASAAPSAPARRR